MCSVHANVCVWVCEHEYEHVKRSNNAYANYEHNKKGMFGLLTLTKTD